ncbi:MAG: polysaccharide biosynthesis protein [Clostridiales Family XIII bacterium]|jgi:FlaA1/EpsC-like NDP-sugar epimerase|nr:polysaccharide biosynthesis protein [Clostridiales Family XIII bacterium]
MVKYPKIIMLMAADAIIINISYITAYLLCFEFRIAGVFQEFFSVYADNIFMITLIKVFVFSLFGLYQKLWRYASSDEILKILGAALIANFAVITFLSLTRQQMPRSVYIIACVFDCVLIGGLRFLFRIAWDWRGHSSVGIRLGSFEFIRDKATRVMLVGSGNAGASIIKEIKNHPEQKKRVVVAVDDDPVKRGRRILGVKIGGDHAKIKEIARKYGVDEIIIAIPSANREEMQEIAGECSKTGCKLKILPAFIDLINEKVSVNALRDVDIEDLLSRDTVKVNLEEISGYTKGRIVMVTGGGGSIGSELCRQIGKFSPRKLVAVDIYENTLFELTNEIKEKYPLLEFEAVIASVRNRERMEEVFLKYAPHVVFHAAAHKHVPLMEMNPKEAVINNILGSKNLIDLADMYAVEKFVMISTDKAVNPVNVMGATKRAAEMILQKKSETSKTCCYATVRFGNVLGSNGSVVPVFKKQIANGGPVTVTHEEITRYFMTVPEAVQLVIQAGAMAKGGEIFILDMGDPVNIKSLAENLIRLSGFIPYEDIDVVMTGLRPGEKLYEELSFAEEEASKTGHEKIFIGKLSVPSESLKNILNGNGGIESEIMDKLQRMTDDEVKEWLHSIVPNYTISEKKSEESELNDERWVKNSV